MSYTFNPSIPRPTDFLSDSQGDLLSNNQALDNIFGRNHYPFSTTSSSQGKHKFVEMVVSDPSTAVPPLAFSTGTIYTKKVGSLVNLFFVSAGFTSVPYQLTNVVAAPDAVNTLGTLIQDPSDLTKKRYYGWTFLGQQIILMYGYADITAFDGNSGDHSAVINFPFSFDSVNSIYSVSLTVQTKSKTSVNDEYKYYNLTTSGMTIEVVNLSDKFSAVDWMVIGKYIGV